MKKFRKILSAALSAAIIAACAVCGTGAAAQTATNAVKATPLTGWAQSSNYWQYRALTPVTPLGYLTTAEGRKITKGSNVVTPVEEGGNLNKTQAFFGMSYTADGCTLYPIADTEGVLVYVKNIAANEVLLELSLDKDGKEVLFYPRADIEYQYAALNGDGWQTAKTLSGAQNNNGSCIFGTVPLSENFEGYIKLPYSAMYHDGGREIDPTTDKIRMLGFKLRGLGDDYGDIVIGPAMLITSDSTSVKIEVPEEYRPAPVKATPIDEWTANRNAAKVTSTVTFPVDEINAQGIKMTAATAFEKSDTGLGANDNYTGFKLKEAEAINGTSGYIFYLKTDSANTVMPHFEIEVGWSYTPAMGIIPGKIYEYRALDADKWSTGTAVACTARSGYDGGIKLDAPFEGFIKVSYASLKNDGITMNTTNHKLANFILKVKGLGDSYGDVTVGPIMLITSDSVSPEIEVPAEYRPSPINVNSIEFKAAKNGAYAFSADPVENGYSLSISDSVLSEDEIKFVGGENGTKKWSYVEADDTNIGSNGLTNLKMTPNLPLAPRDVDGFIVYLKTESANAFAFQLTYEKGTHWTKDWAPEMHLIPGSTVMVRDASSSRWTAKTVEQGKTGNTKIYGMVEFDSAFDGYIKIPYSSVGRDDTWKPYTTVDQGAIDRITEVVFRFKGVGGKLENGLYGNVTAGLVGYFTKDSTSVEINVAEPAYLTGDVNNDCFRDSNDLIQLRKYLLGVEAEINPKYANVDESEDLQVNIIDLVRLKKLISNVE